MTDIVLLDLDGTLLPMDQEIFTKEYFKRLAAKLAPHGYDPEKLVSAIWDGTSAMVSNDGSCSNEEAFWKRFSKIFGDRALSDKKIFDEYYEKEFQEVAECCGFNPKAAETVRRLKKAGYRVALATNPIFPAAATESRIRWAGLSPEDFEYYTTYENTGYCKPNAEYYLEILKKLGAEAERCLMVGNDVEEDMAAASTGMKVFLLTDCLLNKKSKDITSFPQGGFDDLWDFLKI